MKRSWQMFSRSVAVLAVTVAVVVLSEAPAGAAKPPDTFIDSGPPVGTASTSATFTFHASASPATYTCKLDTAAAASCTSPKTYTGLAEGTHTFSVYATVNGTSDQSPATATWTVDTTPPSTPTGLAATTPSATSVALTWNAASDNTGVTGYDVYRDGALSTTVGPITSYTDTVAPGSTHQYAIRARDVAGNVSPLTVTVTATTAALDTVIDSGPPAGTTSSSASFTFHANATPATFTCRLDSATAASCTTPKSYAGLVEGAHTFSVYATVNGTSDPTPATATWTVDTTAPSTPTGLAATTPSATSVALSWDAASDNTGVTGYDVYRDGALLTTTGAVTTYTDTTVLAGSTDQYAVRARDIAGNVSALTSPVTVTTPFPVGAHLTRAPYLTDLVGLRATINFATDQSASTASVMFGAVGDSGACTPTTSVAATRITISVNGIFEFQWKAQLTLAAAGRYCYRPYLGSDDLLGTSPSPQFTTQVRAGSAESYSFAVFGDWGQVDANGDNPDQKNLMRQIAASGARFAISTGDNGYPSGSQGNYGDLKQQGADTSGIFGPSFWGGVGGSLALFPVIGNHGLARSDAVHPHFGNWPEDVAVATSGGRYQKDTYCCVNGTASADYPSPWYAFDAGGARFYLLDAAWADLNTGTADPYANDWAAHWQSTSPEYQWLKADLAAHPSGLKFAFFHYPLYSDQPSESSDTYLQGNSSLEGLLASNGVNLAFSGHAHLYQRNAPATGKGRKSLVSYVTGGGGGQAQSTGACSPNDQYAVGWSYTNNAGTACGAASVPTSPTQVYHFLKVTISGARVTVTPTDELGHTFDVQTYTFNPLPDTYIDSAPPAGTTSTSGTFAFHASSSPATYTCKIDAGAPAPCTSPVTYNGLAQGAHAFSVYATVNALTDPLPATASWTVDTTPPNAPTGLSATATSPFSVVISWTAATDNLGITGYDVYRDSTVLATVASAATSYTDTAVLGSSTHQYAVRARDIAGSLSPLTEAITVTTPSPPVPVFADGFESGDLSAWTSTAGLVVQGATIHSGTHAVEGNTTTGGTYAKKTLPATYTYTDAYARVWYDQISQTDQINLVRMRDASGVSLGYLYLETTGQLGFHNDAAATNTLSSTVPGPGWHALELHLRTTGSTGVVEVWLDNALVADLSGTAIDTGTSPVGQLQIGEVQSGLTYDVAFDDVAFGTSRLGPVGDTSPPSVPANVTATATSPFSVQVGWDASTDDVAVAGYDLFRDGRQLASVDSTTGYTDTSVLAGSTHPYAVRSRDLAGNTSPLSSTVSVTLPAAPVPVFADGFESGDLSPWTSTAGLVVQGTTVHSGTQAAEGDTMNGNTFAKRTLPATYADAYARVWYDLVSQSGQVNLLRMRGAAGASLGYLFLSAGGKLGFHDDATATSTLSATSPGPGWHALELHFGVNGAASTVEVWLDGAVVSDLSTTATDLGTVPIGVLQIGETQTGQTYDVVFDDVALATSRLGPTGDTSPPTVPANLAGTAPSPFSVQVGWDAATDDVGVTGYQVFRDGQQLATVDTTTYTDTTVLASSTHQYVVRARDAAGNVSAVSDPVSVTTPAGPAPAFADGFESGDLSAWTSSGGLAAQPTVVHGGGFAAEGNTTNGNTFAKKILSATYPDAYGRVWYDLVSQAGQVNLLRLRDAAGTSIGYLYVSVGGQLGFHDDATNTNTLSATTPGSGWHALELHLGVNGTSGTVKVWLDGTLISDLSSAAVDLGTAPVASFQIGDTQTARTYDVVFDDAAFGTSRLGPAADTSPPTVPANVTATAASPFSVQVGWDAATDDVAVTGYDVFRDGVLAATLGSVTSYTDGSVLAASTHQYAVRSRDLSGNVSALSPSVSVTTPAAATPVFADGFESGDLSAWTTTGGLTVQSTDVRSGGFAAEGNTTNGNTFAKKTLPATYADAYARVAYELKSQAAQVNLLRLRDAGGVSLGYLYLTTTGQLAFHNDATGASTVTTLVPGGGWHALELHMGINGAASILEVWLDGVAVSSLTSTAVNLGTAPVGILQIGETQTGRTYDVVFDDVAFATSRLGP